MNYAIIYFSKYGQTREIAQFLKSRIHFLSSEKDCVEVLEVSAKDSPVFGSKNSPEFAFAPDVVILGCPVYAGQFSKKFLGWVRKNKAHLQGRRLAVFMVSLNVADKRPEARVADQQLLQKLIRGIDLQPDFVASFAGALKYQDYNWFYKWIMKRISKAAGGPTDTSQNYEMTNWNEVEDFLQAIRSATPDSKFSAVGRFEI